MYKGDKSMKSLIDMTPYELGETEAVEAIPYLIQYLNKGNGNEKRLAASAIRKLSEKYKNQCNDAVPYLLKNLQHMGPQVTQYSLKALLKLDIPKQSMDIIENIKKNDIKEYNRAIAQEILNNYHKEENCTKQQVNADENRLNEDMELLNTIRIKDIYKERKYAALIEECDKVGIVHMKDLGKINMNKIYNDFSTKKSIMLKYYMLINNLQYLKHHRDIDDEILNNVLQERREQLSKSFKSPLGDMDSDYVMKLFRGEILTSNNLYRTYKEHGEKLIELLNEIAEKEALEKSWAAMLKMRYSINEKFYTLAFISGEYNMPREQVELSINKLLNRIGRKIHSSLKRADYDNDILDIYFYLYETLGFYDKKDFIERTVLFVKYGFPDTHAKLIIHVIVLILYGRNLEWKSESIYASYNKHITSLQSIAEQKELHNKINSSIVWPLKVKKLHSSDYININTLSFAEEALRNKGFSYYSHKLNKEVFYKGLLQKDYLLLLEKCDEVIFYVNYPFKVKVKESIILVDIFFVLNNSKGVIMVLPPDELNIKRRDNEKIYAIKQLCKEKGLGLWIV